jgi:hypothetical protein
MRRMFTLVALLAVSGFPGLVYAQTATPVPAPAVNYRLTFTPTEIAVLLQATKDIESNRQSKLLVISKAAADMPTFDPLFHYAGIDPVTNLPVIWMSDKGGKRQAESESKLASLELACMDSGLAGPFWKLVYDDTASYDAHLPQTEPNRYRARLGVTSIIQTAIYQNEFGSH